MKFNARPVVWKGWNGYSGFFSILILLGLLTAAFALFPLHAQQVPAHNDNTSRIVGTWFAKIPEAPFQYHMLSFHPDGTMQQANPDAGDPTTSDSNGMGVWESDGDMVRGKFVEVTADRVTRQFVSRGEISFEIKVKGNAFTGTVSAVFFDVDGNQIRGPLPATLEGQRVVLF